MVRIAVSLALIGMLVGQAGVLVSRAGKVSAEVSLALDRPAEYVNGSASGAGLVAAKIEVPGGRGT